MAKAELTEEASEAQPTSGQVDILVGISGTVELDHLRAAAERSGTNRSIAIAHPGDSTLLNDASLAEATTGLTPSQPRAARVKLMTYKAVSSSSTGAHWLPSGTTYSSLFALAQTTGARACVVINSDIAALENGAVESMAAPVLAGECDLAMPIYAQSRFEGLLNASILSPLTRALYGKRVRYPLAQDFAVSSALLPAFEHPGKRVQAGGDNLFWPATEAAIRDRKVCQVHVNVRHEGVAEGVELTTVLTQVLGPLFNDVETNASVWQRTRGSHAILTFGTAFPAADANSGAPHIDTKPMVESFLLAFSNLHDLWSLILPPVTQLDLKRLTRAASDQFKVPDELWVKIIYDFALAHRLKILSRSHLMGAFAPLYLAWIASYVNEVGALSDAAAEQRLERLAQAYEAGKPYLLSRWRWPDRFNP